MIYTAIYMLIGGIVSGCSCYLLEKDEQDSFNMVSISFVAGLFWPLAVTAFGGYHLIKLIHLEVLVKNYKTKDISDHLIDKDD